MLILNGIIYKYIEMYSGYVANIKELFNCGDKVTLTEDTFKNCDDVEKILKSPSKIRDYDANEIKKIIEFCQKYDIQCDEYNEIKKYYAEKIIPNIIDLSKLYNNKNELYDAEDEISIKLNWLLDDLT